MKKIFLLLPAAALIFACAPQTVNKGTPSTVAISSESISQGKMIYESNCGRCHDLPTVTKYNDEKWKSLIAWMGPKAKLTAQQSDLVYQYVSNSN